MKTYIISGLVALGISVGVIWVAPKVIPSAKTLKIEHANGAPVKGALYTIDENSEIIPLDFTKVAEKVMDAVVHIKSTQTAEYVERDPRDYRQLPDPFRDFFGDDYFDQFFEPKYRYGNPRQQQPQVKVGTGSGVIINDEGYIVTNNHVIFDANDIEVTLYDNRTYKATVIGTDPSTDFALIQIKEKKLQPCHW